MNFSRKTILVVGAALLAACGDKVTVQEYTPPTTTPKVNFVEVTPATATVSTGASITFTAAVNADAGLATTVTWSASAGTVTSAGVFTAPSTANPGISVCATSTVDTGKKGCATVVVTAPAAAIPASISINSIQVTGAVGGATVNPAAVIGAIDVILNVNPGNQTVSKIVLIVGGIRTDSQTFTAAQSAALRYAADEALAAQTTFPQVIFSVNTAAFNATTGVPRWLNGSQGISAQLYTTQGGATTAATATAQTNLIFANPNTVTGSATVTGGNTTTDANGYTWRSGALNATVIPVIYSAGTTVSSVVINFGNGACDNSGAGARIKAATAPAAGSSAWTASFAGGTTGSAADNVATFELNPIGCAGAYVAGGQQVTADVVDGNGNPVAIGIPISATARFRLDNFAPVVGGILPTSVNFFANPNGRNSNWVNGSVTMTAQTATNLDGWLTNPVLDAGVGSPSAVIKVGADQATAIASTTTYTSTSALAPTADASSQCAVLYGRDKLGNTSADPTAAPCGAAGGATEILYGVDKVAPLVTGIRRPGSTSTSSTGRRTSFAGTFFRVIVSDTGIIGNSGMAIANPVRGTVKYRTATVLTTCDVGDPATLTTTCDAANVTNNAARIGVLGGTTAGEVYVAMTPATVNGYYTAAFYSVDAAGNVSAVRTRVSSLDNVLPSVTTASLTNAAIANPGFTFTSLASDNLDLRQYLYYFGYDAVVSPTFFNIADNAPVLGTPAGMPAGYLVPTAAVTPAAAPVNPAAATVYETQTSTAIGTYNGTTLVNSNYQMIGSTTLPLVLQGTTGAFGSVTPVAYNTAAKLSSIFSYTQDQGGTGGTTITTGIAGSVLAPATSVFTTATATPATDITTFNFGAFNSGTGAYNVLGVMGCSGALTRDNGVLSGCQAVLAPNTVEASSFTVRASVVGASPAGGLAGLAQPFSKVLLVAFSEFNVANNTAGAAFMQVLGTLGAPTATDNGATRTWNYTGTLTADANTWDLLGGCSSNAFWCAGASSLYIIRNVYALGIDANGRVALVSQPIALTIKE